MDYGTFPFGRFALTGYQLKLLQLAQKLPGNWIGRRFALILKKIILLKKHCIIDTKIKGLNLRLHTRDNIAERKYLFMPNFFDYYEFNLLRGCLKPGDTFVDVGANAGIYTLTAAALVGREGVIIAIEPNPMLVQRLIFNLSINTFQERVIIEQCGVYDHEGTFDLFLDQNNLGESSLNRKRLSQKIIIQCYTLLQLLQKNRITTIDALKIDIEGVEDKVLFHFFLHAPVSLYPKLIIVENSLQYWEADLPNELRNKGYKLLKTTRLNQIWLFSNKTGK